MDEVCKHCGEGNGAVVPGSGYCPDCWNLQAVRDKASENKYMEYVKGVIDVMIEDELLYIQEADGERTFRPTQKMVRLKDQIEREWGDSEKKK